MDTNEEPLWWTFSTQFVGFSLAILLIIAGGDIVPAGIVAVFGWDTKSIEWASGVLFCSLVALALTCGVLMPLRKFLNEKRLCGIAGWVRWVLFVPAAIALGWLVEVIPRFLFNLAEVIINRQITLRSGFDEFIWQCWEPLLVVAFMVDLAPRGKSVVLLAGAALKGFFWCRSVWDSFTFVKGWGRYAQSHPWSFPSELTNCPIWWRVLVQLFFLVALAMLVAKTRTVSVAKRGEPKSAIDGRRRLMFLRPVVFRAYVQRGRRGRGATVTREPSRGGSTARCGVPEPIICATTPEEGREGPTLLLRRQPKRSSMRHFLGRSLDYPCRTSAREWEQRQTAPTR